MRWLVLAFLAGCAPQSPSWESDEPIVGGVDSDPSQNSVVRLSLRTDGGIYQCTGTLIAPNLVLTARHCVSATADGNVRCNMDGVGDAGGAVFGDYPPSSISIGVGLSRMRNRDGGMGGMGGTNGGFGGMGDGGTRVRGMKILHDDATNLCNHDLALILLDAMIPSALISPLRLDGPPVKGESLTAVGWGVSDKSPSPPIRQQRTGVVIEEVGPSAARGGIASNEFMVGEAPCEGDSGGPALASHTQAIVGVVSRGGNGFPPDPSDPSGSCVGAGEENLYSAVAPYKALILDAFAQAGAQPWLEGQPNPIGAPFGAPCAVGGECASGMCYGAGDAGAGFCTADCTSQPCAAGYECLKSDALDALVCSPPPPPPPSPTPSPVPHKSGGCATGGEPLPRALWLWAVAAVIAATRARRAIRAAARR